MGEIISSEVFKQRLRSREQKKVKASSIAEIENTFDQIIHIVGCEWELNFRRNTLPQLFSNVLKKDYGNVLELQVLKQIERDLSMNPVVFAPNSMTVYPNEGWVACFTFDEINYATPPMAEEEYARALNVLLFLELKQYKRMIDGNVSV